jgi:endoribonuclease LACTB2
VCVAVTHHHEDHVGGATFLARELGLPLWAHDLTVERLPEEAKALVGRRLKDGDTFVLDGPKAETWRVLHTPGHAPGHVCLQEPNARTLVVGDMVASVGTILIAPGDGDMQVYLEQLERLADLGGFVALPAHGDPIDEPTALFRKYVAHRLMREAKVLAAVEKAGVNGATAIDLVPVAYDDTPVHLYPIAKLSLEMHLEKLVREGKVARGANLTFSCGNAASSR